MEMVVGKVWLFRSGPTAVLLGILQLPSLAGLKAIERKKSSRLLVYRELEILCMLKHFHKDCGFVRSYDRVTTDEQGGQGQAQFEPPAVDGIMVGVSEMSRI